MFTTIYLIGLISMFSVRLWYRWRGRNNQIVVNRRTALEIVLLIIAFIGMLVIPLTYVFTPLLNFANYQLPFWAGWMGVVVFLAALVLLLRTHADLGRNWSASLELRKGHQLITTGVYTFIRHPMYAALLLWGVAQPLLLHNWIAGWSQLVSFLPLYLLRVPREEQMMKQQFGAAYQAYMQQTGRVIPRVFSQQAPTQKTNI